MRIIFSAVIDGNEKFYNQFLLMAKSLIENCKVKPSDIYAHLVVDDGSRRQHLESVGINIVLSDRFGDGKYCNKLSQYSSLQDVQFDYVFLCDCDLYFTGKRNPQRLSEPSFIRGKVVDAANPPIAILSGIYSHFDIESPKVTETFTGPTFVTNINGGFIGIPRNIFKEIGTATRDFATRILDDADLMSSLDRWSHHVDQIAFSLAVSRYQYCFRSLGIEDNFPTHSPHFTGIISSSREESDANVLHYHADIGKGRLIKSTGIDYVDDHIEAANEMISELFG